MVWAIGLVGVAVAYVLLFCLLSVSKQQDEQAEASEREMFL